VRFWNSSNKSGAGRRIANTSNSLYLNNASVGETYTMLGLEGGQRFREKIYSMGLNPGVKFKILQNSGNGPVEIQVRQTKLAIGRGMTSRIKIRAYGTPG